MRDAGYSLRENVMIPFENPVKPDEVAFNRAHKKSRCTIERGVGILKSRFRCLCKQSGGAIAFDVHRTCRIIASCIVLHNYCRDRNIAIEIDEDIEKEFKLCLTSFSKAADSVSLS